MTSEIIFNSDLLEDVARRRVVLFIGAGASKWAKPRSGGSFKGWAEFLTAANSQVTDSKINRIIKECIKTSDFLIASELLKENLQERWNSILSEEFQQAADISRLHKALISLDQRILITTNFDKLIENAWSETTSRYPRVISKIDHKAFRLFRDNESYLIKLHGSIDEPENIVFDKTSYQSTAYGNRFYRELIGTLLLTHTFIFIGFSMADPAISLIVESHAHRFSDTRPHYVFLSGKSVPIIDDLSKKLRKLFVIRYDDKDHHIALATTLESLSIKAQEERRRILTLESSK